MFPNIAVVEYHLRRLDGEDLVAFVADLWAARGYETTREGGRVVATHETGSVHVVVTGRGIDTVRRGVDGSVDVVVAFDGTATRDAATVVGATDLAEMLAYAVDRDVARELCERHLGAAPADLSHPPLRRANQRVRGVLDRSSPTVLLGLVVVLVGVGAVAGFATLSLPGDSNAVLADEAPTPAVQTPVFQSEAEEATGEVGAELELSDSERPFPSSVDTPPPGMSSDELIDVEALAIAHERAMANRSHTVWLDQYWPRNLNPNRTRIQRDIDIFTDGERYLIQSTEIEQDSDTRERLGDVYYNGIVPYGAVWDETNGSYGRVFSIDPRHDISPTPETVRKRVVSRYLSTPETRVTNRTSRDGTTVYRVVGTGQPNSSAFGDIDNYTVVAAVDARGFVRNATVEYAGTSVNRTYRIRREITYDRIGSTTVEPPEWYRNRDGADGSGDGESQ